MAAAAYKVLGQVAPTNTSETTLYTAGAGVQTLGSTLLLCNRTGDTAVVDVNVRPAGAAVAARHSIIYQTPIAGNTTLALTLGITLAPTDVISVKLGTGNSIAITLFGTEIS